MPEIVTESPKEGSTFRTLTNHVIDVSVLAVKRRVGTSSASVNLISTAPMET